MSIMNISEKGREGELALNRWLNENGLSYLYIDQSTETFSTLFKGSLKRPDFLVVLESIGMLAVDAKNHQLSGGVFTLNFDNEFQKALSFERIFRIPLWYAYKGEVESNEVWYWISALKAIETGEFRENSSTGEKFLAIKIEHFEQIATNQDLGKLYTHRLPSIKKIAKEAPDLKSVKKVNKVEKEDDPLKEFKKVYDFSNNYDQQRIQAIIDRLICDVAFPIYYRRGEDDYFCSESNEIDKHVVALIDRFSIEVLMGAGSCMETITVKGQEMTASRNFVIDHLIYAVSSVFYDDKSQADYEIELDESRLTDKAREVVEVLKGKNFSVNIGMDVDVNDFQSGYALFATLS